MADHEELYEIDIAEVIAETDKAIHILTPAGTRHWIAKSQIVERGDDSMLIPYWLADQARIASTIEAATDHKGVV